LNTSKYDKKETINLWNSIHEKYEAMNLGTLFHYAKEYNKDKDSHSYKPQRRTEKGSSTTQKGTPPVNGLLRWAPARKDRIWQWGAAPFAFPKRARWCPSRKFDFYFRFVNSRIPNTP
jgi:hypothetical protein